MTKNNLIDQVTETTECTKTDAEQIVEAVLGQIAEALTKGEKIDLRGFGTFQVSGKKERQGRNPRTGEALTIAARKVVVFKPSKELAARVDGPATVSEQAGDGELRRSRLLRLLGL